MKKTHKARTKPTENLHLNIQVKVLVGLEEEEEKNQVLSEESDWREKISFFFVFLQQTAEALESAEKMLKDKTHALQ